MVSVFSQKVHSDKRRKHLFRQQGRDHLCEILMDKKKVSFERLQPQVTQEEKAEEIQYSVDEKIPVPSLAILMSLVNEVRHSIANFKSVT